MSSQKRTSIYLLKLSVCGGKKHWKNASEQASEKVETDEKRKKDTIETDRDTILASLRTP